MCHLCKSSRIAFSSSSRSLSSSSSKLCVCVCVCVKGGGGKQGKEKRICVNVRGGGIHYLNLVSSPDLIRQVYRFQYNVRKVICAGVGFGSGTETNLNCVYICMREASETCA